MKRNKKIKENEGITLIALIITVIVMIILAFTTINLFIGENGIFKKSNEGAEIYKNSANDEARALNELDNKMGDLMNKIDGKPKLIINLVEFTENKRIQGDCTIEVYTDKDCKNLLKTITITKQDYTQERCYETDDVPEEGTYYLMVKNVPTGYVRLNYINTKTITKGQNNIWEIAFIIEDSPNAQEGLYDREYAMSYTFTYPSEVEEGLEFPVKVYKIGEYDERYNIITYDAKLNNLGLKELSILDISRTWTQKDLEFAKKIEEVVKANNIEAVAGEITEHQNGIITGLDAAGVYFIDLEDIDSLEHHYSCRPLLYTHYPYYQMTYNKDAIFDLAIYKESIYDKERLKGKVKINSNVSNYNQEKGAVTVVYEVQATTVEGEVLYSDIVKTTYNKEVAGYTIIDNIPAGANVTAKVKYVSPSYQIYTEDTQFGICISDKDVAQGLGQCELHFDFAYNGIKSTGWGILEMQMEHDEQRANWNVKNIKNELNRNMKVNYKEENGQKNIAITNTVAEECFVRLKILTPPDVNIELMHNAQNWEMDGEYWCYRTVLGGNKTIQVPLEIDNSNQEGRKIGNVVIAVERVQVLQDSEGNPFVNWEEIEEE